VKTDKIREAIADLQEQRGLLDNAIQSLQTILVRLNGHSSSQVAMPFGPETPSVLIDQGSYVDMAVQLLQASGHPMHVKQIWEQIKVLRNNPNIKRGSVESTLLRHIEAKRGETRLRKVRPATYGLPKPAEAHPVEPPTQN